MIKVCRRMLQRVLSTNARQYLIPIRSPLRPILFIYCISQRIRMTVFPCSSHSEPNNQIAALLTKIATTSVGRPRCDGIDSIADFLYPLTFCLSSFSLLYSFNSITLPSTTSFRIILFLLFSI